MHFFKKKSIAIGICFVAVFLIFYFLYCFYLSAGKNVSEKIFKIEKNESVFSISENLKKQGLVKNKFIFIFYLALTGKHNKIQAGYYFLKSSISIPEIAKKFVSGETAKIKITIPEGFTIKQIQERLDSFFHFSGFDFKVREFKKDFEFLQNVPNEAFLEGFLFPDTYEFSYEMSEKEMVSKMLENFAEKIQPLKEEIKKQNKTIFEIIIMASLIEREVKTLEDKKICSGILWKRLKAGMPLQVDATINYILKTKTTKPEEIASQSYGTKILIKETKIDSPYNTYKYKGLPFGPICNPGKESILAAIEPENSEYWYYLSSADGKTIFSKTLEQHNAAKAKYLE